MKLHDFCFKMLKKLEAGYPGGGMSVVFFFENKAKHGGHDAHACCCRTWRLRVFALEQGAEL